MIESSSAISAPVMVTPVFISHLEDLVDDVFLGDMAGERIADRWMSSFTVASSLFWSWTIVRRPLSRVPLMSATSLQRVNGRGVVFRGHHTRFSPLLSGGGGSSAVMCRARSQPNHCDGDERNGCAEVLRRSLPVPARARLPRIVNVLLCVARLRPDGLRVNGTAGSGAAIGNVPLDCTPSARAVSGVQLRGAAADWWAQAEGRYRRTQTPAVGSVLVFRRPARLPDGHVAVVSSVLSERRIW